MYLAWGSSEEPINLARQITARVGVEEARQMIVALTALVESDMYARVAAKALRLG